MSQSVQYYRAKWIVSHQSGVFENGYIALKNGVIVNIGSGSSGEPSIDLGEIALIPGLINPHTHLEFSNLKQPIGEPSQGFVEWVRKVINRRRAIPTEDLSKFKLQSIHSGILESIKSGVVVIGEIATEPIQPEWYSSPGLATVAFIERIISSNESLDAGLAGAMEIVNSLRGKNSPAGLSPHAPYTVTTDALAGLVDIATAKDLPIAMHLAESPEEMELLRSDSGPFIDLLESVDAQTRFSEHRYKTLLEYLEQLNRCRKVLVIHGNYFGHDEFEFMGRHADTMTLVYCPRTHHFFGHPPYPVELVAKHAVHFALGTDSRASSPDLNLWREQQFVLNTYQGLNPQETLKWITINAARALGVDNTHGDLGQGYTDKINVLPVEASTVSEVFESFKDEYRLPIPLNTFLNDLKN